MRIIQGGKSLVFQEVGAVFFGAFEGLFPPPFFDFCVISAKQDVGDLHSAKVLGAGVLWVFECQRAGVAEGIIGGGVFVAEGAGQETDDGVDYYHSGQLAAGQDVIADRDLLGVEARTDTFVEAFVPASDENQAFFAGKLDGFLLGEGLALRGEQHRPAGVGILFLDVFEAVEQGPAEHNHTGTAAVGFIIDFVMRGRGEIADVGDGNIDEAFIAGALNYRMAQRRFEHFREYCQDINSHFLTG